MKSLAFVLSIRNFLLLCLVVVGCTVLPRTETITETYALESKTEQQIVAEHCNGDIEHRLSDNTRVDCLTRNIAWEYDWAEKWAEAIGQSLHYALMTGKQPGIVLLCKTDCAVYKQRFKRV